MKYFRLRGIFLGFIINIVIVLVLARVSYKRERITIEINNLEIDHNRVAGNIEKVLSIINSIENNAKGYVISGSEKYLEEFNRNVYEISKKLEDLKLSYENRIQSKEISELDALINEKIQYNNRFVEVKKYKNFEEAKTSVPFEKDIQATNRLNQIISRIKKNEDVFFLESKVKKERLKNSLGIVSVILFVVIVMLLVLVLLIILYNQKTRKKAGLLLEENRQLLQSIFDNTSNAIFIKELNGEYILVNKQFESLFHYTNQQLKGKTDHEIFPKEFADKYRSTDIDVVKAGKEIRVEEKFPQDDGLHTYLVVKFPLWDVDGKIYAIGGIATDVTESEKTNILLKESEEEIKSIFQAAPDAVIVINEESIIQKWNTKAEILFGWKADEVIGKSLPEVIMPLKYRERHFKGMKHFVETGEGPILNKTIEISAQNKNKIEFEIDLTISFIKRNNKYLFTAFIRDITNRKQLETEAKRSEIFLNSIIENIPDMIVVKDAEELRFVRFNKAGEKLLGYSASELIGKNDYDFFSKEQADSFILKDREALNKGMLINIEEEQVDAKNGKHWLHTQKMPLPDENGKFKYVLDISEDITEKKKLKDEHDEAERSLIENEKRMMLILDNIGEAVVVVNSEKKVILSNQMAEERWGIKEDSESSSWFEEYKLFYPDETTIFPAQEFPLVKALKGESSDEVEIVLLEKASQENRRAKFTSRPIMDENSNIIAAVITIRDITKYKELEIALEKSTLQYRKLIGFGKRDNQ